MEYSKLLNYLNFYGISKESIVERRGLESILSNVVVAPWWEHTLFSSYCDRIEQVSEKVFNIYGDGFEFSFIEIKNMGASALMEEVLALGVTNAKRILFIGSAGSIDENINIGDLVVPTYSYNGVGATRYLNESLDDDFENKYYPCELLSNDVMEVSKDICECIHNVINYSVDTIISQFPHINHIVSLGCKTIEMETSCLFKCCEMIGVETSALFVISDNTVLNKSLYNGRKDEDSYRKKIARKEYVPKVVIEVFKKYS